MVKATLRSAVLLGTVAAAMFAASVPGFAEVQNVRVGGDVTLRAIKSESQDLDTDDGSTTGTTNFDSGYWSQLTAGLNVGADLTENVSAYIRLVSERNLGGSFTAGGASGDFDISQAWAKFKELFYSPLTVTVGTQPIWWGRGLVLGSNLLPSLLSATGGPSGAGNDRNESISANQFTDFTAFDAIRAQLDLSGAAAVDLPMNLEYVYIKQAEGVVDDDDDVTIQGLKLATNMDEMSSELEAYYLFLRDKSRTNQQNRGSVSTLGLRGSTQPAEGTMLYAEAALQFGHLGTDLDGSGSSTTPGSGIHSGAGAQAWLLNLGGEVSLGDDAMGSKAGAEWILTTGHDKDGAFSGWQAIAPGYFPTLIRAFQTRSTITGLYPVDQTGVTSAFTNQHELALYGGLKPMEDLGVDTRLSWFLADVPIKQATNPVGNGGRNRHLGTEWDTWVTYNYTDDVQFGVSYGLFLPGSAFRAGAGEVSSSNNTAQQLVSTVSVKF